MAVAASLALVGCVGREPAFDGSVAELTGGAVSNRRPASVSLDRCTGVLIAPTFVLTAAHCVILEGLFHPPYSVARGDGFVTISKRYVHPAFQRCRPAGSRYAGTAGTDLAVVELESPYDDVAPAALAPSGVRPAVPLGSELDLVGFGLPDQKRRFGRFTLTGIQDDGVVLATGADAGICPGDSGGALYLSDRRADVVLGIVASQPYGTTALDNCAVGNTTLFADVSMPSNRAFIDAVLAGEAAPFLAKDVPHCCVPGATQACEGGEQQIVCGDDGQWPSCPATVGAPAETSETP